MNKKTPKKPSIFNKILNYVVKNVLKKAWGDLKPYFTEKAVEFIKDLSKKAAVAVVVGVVGLATGAQFFPPSATANYADQPITQSEAAAYKPTVTVYNVGSARWEISNGSHPLPEEMTVLLEKKGAELAKAIKIQWTAEMQLQKTILEGGGSDKVAAASLVSQHAKEKVFELNATLEVSVKSMADSNWNVSPAIVNIQDQVAGAYPTRMGNLFDRYGA